jgi:nicotinamidase-related amidase
LVPVINRLAAHLAASGVPVFDVRIVHKADRSTWSRLMLMYDQPCLIEGTEDVELVAGLQMPAAARFLPKCANSAFLGTDLEGKLRGLKVDRLILAGAFIDGCVALTAADAAQRGVRGRHCRGCDCPLQRAPSRHDHRVAGSDVRAQDHEGG